MVSTVAAARACLLGACLALLYAAPSGAALLEDLFAVRVPVAGQSVVAREEALKAAITQVLVRMTGRANMAHATAVAELIRSPRSYLHRYRYERGEDGQLELIARFDGYGLRRALARRGIPTWQVDWPPVLVWFAFDSGGTRELITAGTGQHPREALRQAAAELGISVIFPLLDLLSRRHVRYSDITGGFSEPVLAASQRYATSLVLMLWIVKRENSWNGHWALYRNGTEMRWESQGERLESVLADGVQALAAHLRPKYTILPDLTGSSLMQIRINGVDSLERFAAVEHLVAKLPGVIATRLSGAGASWVRMQLTLDVAPNLVQQELRRSPKLEPVAPPPQAQPGERTAGDQPRVQSAAIYRLIL